VLIGFKPAVDAYNIAKGKKQEKGQSLDPLAELTVMKEVEMFAESIPGVIIQLMAIANGGGDVAAWVSVVVSALTTGYGGAVISYDWDTDPERREQVLDFYGYVPSNPRQRSAVFITMVLFGGGMLMIRSLTIVLLGLLDMSWALAYISLDLGLYLAVKILREDFWYWVPLGGNVEIASSLFARVMIKIVGDFTCIVLFRHPFELGGMYWSMSVVLTLISLPIAMNIYEKIDEGIISKMTVLRTLMYILLPGTITSLLIFFLNIKRTYIRTFFSRETCKQLTIRRFQETNDDTVKASFSFLTSNRYWQEIEGDVKEWVTNGWHTWTEEKPNWFTEHWRACVPLSYIPQELREEEKKRSDYKEQMPPKESQVAPS